MNLRAAGLSGVVVIGLTFVLSVTAAATATTPPSSDAPATSEDPEPTEPASTEPPATEPPATEPEAPTTVPTPSSTIPSPGNVSVAATVSCGATPQTQVTVSASNGLPNGVWVEFEDAPGTFGADIAVSETLLPPLGPGESYSFTTATTSNSIYGLLMAYSGVWPGWNETIGDRRRAVRSRCAGRRRLLVALWNVRGWRRRRP